ncbi:MAG: murein L,D-transpeptidase catalytic domain-containing protein [Gemmatimonadota bacterium]
MRFSIILLAAAAAFFLAFVDLDPTDLTARTMAQPASAEELGRSLPPADTVSLLGVPISAEEAAAEVAARNPTARAIDAAVSRLGGLVVQSSHPGALEYAARAYYQYKEKHPEAVRKPYFYFIDFGLDANTPRGYVFDMDALEVVEGPFTVAHGSGSVTRGSTLPTRFLNRSGSNATSLGLYVAQETYTFRGRAGGRPYKSIGLRLQGVSGEFNDAARARGIVVHGAPYVTAGRAGRSQGCPAMEQHLASKLIPQIANGGLVFHFSPNDARWMAQDPWALPTDGRYALSE